MPADGSHTRNRIIRSASRLFALHGFDGVSMRSIASDAEVPLKLVQYHCGNKEDLYRAVWEAGTEGRAAKRRVALEAVDYDQPLEKVLRDLMDIFARPLAQARQQEEPHWILSMLARESIDDAASDRGLIETYLDPEARLFIDAFAKALPGVARDEIVLCLLWSMSGIFYFYLAFQDRYARLIGKPISKARATKSYESLLGHSVAGWMQLAQTKG